MSNFKGRLRTVGVRIVYGHKASSERYQSWLREQGVRIGQRVRFYSPWTIRVDTQRPWMIEIGDDVSIGSGATILAVSICDGVVIGAGSVVTKSITEKGVWAGNPARLLRRL